MNAISKLNPDEAILACTLLPQACKGEKGIRSLIRKYWMDLNQSREKKLDLSEKILDGFWDDSGAVWAQKEGEKVLAYWKQLRTHYFQILNSKTFLELAQKCQAEEIHTCSWMDDCYPHEFRLLKNPPPWLFYRGEEACTLLQFSGVTVIGTRKPTPYGLYITREICQFLAHKQIPVLSGFARGIDRQAHESTLEAGGLSLGILANGLDICYPASNRDLWNPMLRQGGFLSEFPPGVHPQKTFFPARNRLLSRLALAVLIPEAAVGSGSLITASFAAEQNVPLWVVPGSIYSMQSQGCNLLISEGAHIFTRTEEFLESLAECLSEKRYLKKKWTSWKVGVEKSEERKKQGNFCLESKNKKALIKALAASPMSVENLNIHLKIAQDQLLVLLTDCMVEGLIFTQNGMYSVTEKALTALNKMR